MRTWWVWTVLVGCAGKTKGDTVGEGSSCDETRAPLALDEVSPLGFSAAELLARLPASETVPLTYSDASVTELTLTYAPAASAEFVDLEPKPSDGSIETLMYAVCEDLVEVGVDVTLSTADGLFDEALEAPLRAMALDTASMRAELPLDAMGGTFSIDAFTDETAYTDASAWALIVLGDGATTGDLHGQVSGGGDCEEGEVCTAWAADVPIGTWGAAAER